MRAGDLAPSRYERARFKLGDILARRHDGQTALIVYAGDTHVVTPLSDDARTLAAMLPALSPDIMPAAGNDLPAAVELAVSLARGAGVARGRLLVVTDRLPVRAARRSGPASRGIGPRAVAARERHRGRRPDPAAAGRLPARARRQHRGAGHGHRHHARGRGRRGRALRAAEPGRQRYRRAAAAAARHRHRSRRHSRAPSTAGRTAGPGWRSRCCRWPRSPSAAAGCSASRSSCCCRNRAPRRWNGRTCGSTRTSRARAPCANRTRRAPRNCCRSPAWRGAAQYEAGDHAGAAVTWAAQDDADAHYNRGNALARAGANSRRRSRPTTRRWRAHPGMDDAVANRKLVDEAMKQRQQRQGQGGQQQDGQQGQEGQRSRSRTGNPRQTASRNRQKVAGG